MLRNIQPHLFLIIITWGAALYAQSPVNEQAPPALQSTVTSPVASIPKNPSDIIRLASTMNGVDLPSVKPWHIKLSYDEFDEEGSNVHSGTLEEFHMSPVKYKRIYTTDNFNQTEIANGSAVFRSGDQIWPPSVPLQVRNEALRPFYRTTRQPRNVKLDKIDWPVGSAKIPCVIFRHTDLIISDNGLNKYCFDSGTIRLRYTRGSGWDETTFNNFVLFDGRYVARDIAVTTGGKAFLNIHIEKLEEIAEAQDSFFKPPPDSPGPLGGRITISADQLLDEYLIAQPPLRSSAAKGKVNVSFVVGKDGSVIEAKALDGPADLQKAALDTIRGYKFHPFLILDQPVEVESRMSFERY